MQDDRAAKVGKSHRHERALTPRQRQDDTRSQPGSHAKAAVGQAHHGHAVHRPVAPHQVVDIGVGHRGLDDIEDTHQRRQRQHYVDIHSTQGTEQDRDKRSQRPQVVVYLQHTLARDAIRQVPHRQAENKLGQRARHDNHAHTQGRVSVLQRQPGQRYTAHGIGECVEADAYP